MKNQTKQKQYLLIALMLFENDPPRTFFCKEMCLAFVKAFGCSLMVGTVATFFVVLNNVHFPECVVVHIHT